MVRGGGGVLCWRAALGVVCLWLASASPARAQSTSDQQVAGVPTRLLREGLTVDAGASCLDATRLVEHIAMWLGRDRIASSIRIQASGDATDPLKITFQLTDGARVAHRVFESSPEVCGDMHAVVGLAIALAIDAELLSEVVANDAEATTPQRHLASVQLSIGYEALPELSLGMTLGGEVGVASWLSVRLDGLSQWSQNDTVGGSAGNRARFDSLLVASALGLCAGGQVEQGVRLSLCLGAGAGVVYAAGRNLSPNRSDISPWLATLGGVRIEAWLGLPWVLDLTVVTPIVAPRFEVGPVDAPAAARHSSSGAFLLSFGPALAL